MKNGSTTQNTKYIVAIIISLIIGASILGYGYLSYRYKMIVLEQQIKADQQKQKTFNENRIKQDECLNDVTNRFKNLKTTNISDAGAKLIIDEFNNQKAECYKKYPTSN